MWYTLSTKEVERQMQTNIEFGLNEKQVEDKQNKFGLNKLEEKKKESIIIKFVKQFNDFMIIILIIASIISAVVAKLEGSNDYFDSIIIIAIVVFNAIMGLVQEAKAEKSLEALKKMTAPTCKVKRDGKICTIKSEQIVPGDIVLLEAGNYVPADCRLIESHNLKIEESSLTGETEPVLKDANMIAKPDIPLGDMLNMAFMASIVVNGHGKAVVTETGMNTKVGKIANMIMEDETPETPIQKKLSQVGKILGIVCLAICVLIFAIGSTIFSIVGPKILGNATTEIYTGLMNKINQTGGIDFTKIGQIILFALGLYVISAAFSMIPSSWTALCSAGVSSIPSRICAASTCGGCCSIRFSCGGPTLLLTRCWGRQSLPAAVLAAALAWWKCSTCCSASRAWM